MRKHRTAKQCMYLIPLFLKLVASLKESPFKSLKTLASVIKATLAIRGHWEVENKVHWVLDVTYKEDDSRVRRENAAENIATARRFALNLARLHPKKDSMRGKLKQAMWSDDFRYQIIFGHNVCKV